MAREGPPCHLDQKGEARLRPFGLRRGSLRWQRLAKPKRGLHAKALGGPPCHLDQKGEARLRPFGLRRGSLRCQRLAKPKRGLHAKAGADERTRTSTPCGAGT